MSLSFLFFFQNRFQNTWRCNQNKNTSSSRKSQPILSTSKKDSSQSTSQNIAKKPSDDESQRRRNVKGTITSSTKQTCSTSASNKQQKEAPLNRSVTVASNARDNQNESRRKTQSNRYSNDDRDLRSSSNVNKGNTHDKNDGTYAQINDKNCRRRECPGQNINISSQDGENDKQLASKEYNSQLGKGSTRESHSMQSAKRKSTEIYAGAEASKQRKSDGQHKMSENQMREVITADTAELHRLASKLKMLLSILHDLISTQAAVDVKYMLL